MTTSDRFYLGIDVGTGGARAGVFDGAGVMRGMGIEPIRVWRPQDDHVEQSSEDIWHACGVAIRGALAEANVGGEQISGIGFDATCSLVVLGIADAPLSVSPGAPSEQNVIVWMDHRAVEEAERITATGHPVLRYVGGTVSPEMQMPKLRWLKAHHPDTWKRATRFLDLPDFLSYRATGVDTRSLCTTTCKWNYLGHENGPDGSPGRWPADFLDMVGLADLSADGFARIGRDVRPIGERAGTLTSQSAADLGLAAGTPVAVSIIDAHAGGLGLLGTPIDGPVDDAGFDTRLALIGGTSSCHMAVSLEPRFVPGVWGPYFSAMVPGFWLTEGGQSATGALIDHVVFSHARGAELRDQAARENTTAFQILNDRLDPLAAGGPPARLTADLHVMPDFHGNRSPRANPRLRGMISGLRLVDSLDSLAMLYLATIQAIAYGTRHILESMNAQGYAIQTLIACGGDTKNPVFVREHADATGCRVVLPREPEAVLLGSAMMAEVASGGSASLMATMRTMSGARAIVEPAKGETAGYHDRKYQVFHRMHDDQIAYGRIMA